MRCNCLTTSGQQCVRDASTKQGDNPQFCWQHQKCSKIYGKSKMTTGTSKTTGAQKKPSKASVSQKVPLENIIHYLSQLHAEKNKMKYSFIEGKKLPLNTIVYDKPSITFKIVNELEGGEMHFEKTYNLNKPLTFTGLLNLLKEFFTTPLTKHDTTEMDEEIVNNITFGVTKLVDLMPGHVIDDFVPEGENTYILQTHD